MQGLVETWIHGSGTWTPDPTLSDTPRFDPVCGVGNPAPYSAPLYEFCLTPLFGRGNESGKHGNPSEINRLFTTGISEVISSNRTIAFARSPPGLPMAKEGSVDARPFRFEYQSLSCILLVIVRGLYDGAC